MEKNDRKKAKRKLTQSSAQLAFWDEQPFIAMVYIRFTIFFWKLYRQPKASLDMKNNDEITAKSKEE